MKKLLLLCLILFSTKLLAQTHTETIAGCAGNFIVTSETQTDKSYKITVTDAADPTKSVVYPIKTTDLDVFATALKDKVISLMSAAVAGACTPAQTDALTVAGKKFYFALIASNTNDDPNAIPIAGTIRIKDQANVYVKKAGDNDYGTSANQYKVQKVQIEINNGFIENIRAYILISGTVYYFNNIYGMGFTSVTNFKDLSEARLYETNSSPYLGKSKLGFYLKLSGLLDYDYDLELDRRDYSPANIKVTIKGGDSQKLYKLATNKLFEAKIYTDFMGLSENKPNGLVQTEVNKTINLNTIQHLSPIFLYPFFKSFGFFQTISPVINISKIEQHNRNLILNDLDSLRLHPGKNDTTLLNSSKHRYTTALALYQYQSYSFGFDLNILNLTNHDLKYTLNFNLGARLGITSLTDSLTKIADGKISKTGFVSNFTVNTLQLAPSATITFLPEERFNFSISDVLLMVKPVGNNFQLLSFDRATNQKATYPVKTWLNTVELQMAIQVNPNSKLFARGRLISELHNINNNFSQIQVGYSTYILGNK
jgi:hypothetical protein